MFIDGKLAGKFGDQMVCPLKRLGGSAGNSFVGKVQDLRVWNRAFSAKEIGRAAGLEIPDNLAEKCPVTATRTDGGFLPEHITDGNMGTRWSSGGGRSDSATIDLGTAKRFNTVKIAWEHAYAKKYAITVSADGEKWTEVYSGEGRDGDTAANFRPTDARFVRITGIEPATQWGYSIWETEVYLAPAT